MLHIKSESEQAPLKAPAVMHHKLIIYIYIPSCLHNKSASHYFVATVLLELMFFGATLVRVAHESQNVIPCKN